MSKKKRTVEPDGESIEAEEPVKVCVHDVVQLAMGHMSILVAILISHNH